MKPDDILFAPLSNWRQLCQDIGNYIDTHRDHTRLTLPLNRPRPSGALLLEEFAEAYHHRTQRQFWRLEYPNVIPREFEFDGIIKHADLANNIPFPVFGEAGHSHYRSIEDVNLVTNTYTWFYVFGSYDAAIQAACFLSFIIP